MLEHSYGNVNIVCSTGFRRRLEAAVGVEVEVDVGVEQGTTEQCSSGGWGKGRWRV